MAQKFRRAEGRGLLRRPAFWVTLAVAVVIAVLAVFLVFRPAASPVATPTAAPTTPEGNPSPTRTPASPVASPSATPAEASPTGDPKASHPAELEAVRPNESVQGKDGMKVALTRIEAVQGEAIQPGERAGPSVRVTITVTNGTNEQFDTNTVSVNAYVGKDRTPVSTLIQPGGVPFLGRLAPGESTYAVYLFVIPADQRKDVTITVDYAVAVPMVVFHGDLG